MEFGRKDNKVPGCQFPHNHACGVQCRGRQEVHHIIPQRYARVVLQAPKEKVDQPLNGITVCQNSHVGTERSLHPDQPKARRTYGQNKNSYQEMFDQRNELTQQGKPYWNRQYDRELREQARNNTHQAKEEGWEFPRKGTIFQRGKQTGEKAG